MRNYTMTVQMAKIAVCRDSLQGFTRRNPKPLDEVFNTARQRAIEILPIVKEINIEAEILCNILHRGLCLRSELPKLEGMLLARGITNQNFDL